jgi:S-DNA-T family DNA segregation ATPase FtsK/SpoIIIE
VLNNYWEKEICFICLLLTELVRIHAPFVSDNEIEKINNFLRNQAEPDYIDEILNFADEKEIGRITAKIKVIKMNCINQALEYNKSEGKLLHHFYKENFKLDIIEQLELLI